MESVPVAALRGPLPTMSPGYADCKYEIGLEHSKTKGAQGVLGEHT